METKSLVKNESAVNQELVTQDHLEVADMRGQVKLLQQLMKDLLIKDEHYGVIPGCGDKPTLLKPGAEKISMMFRLSPHYEIRQTDLPNGHREYVIVCSLSSIVTGKILGQGVGSCSTMEGKYRYRVAPKTSTGNPVPKEYWDLRKDDPDKAQKVIGGKGFAVKKNPESNRYEIFEGSDQKIEHDNPADYYNTVLKMAKKRAMIDAILTVTAASDIFTQDLEDMPEVIPGASKVKFEEKHNDSPEELTNNLTDPKKEMIELRRKLKQETAKRGLDETNLQEWVTELFGKDDMRISKVELEKLLEKVMEIPEVKAPF